MRDLVQRRLEGSWEESLFCSVPQRWSRRQREESLLQVTERAVRAKQREHQSETHEIALELGQGRRILVIALVSSNLTQLAAE